MKISQSLETTAKSQEKSFGLFTFPRKKVRLNLELKAGSLHRALQIKPESARQERCDSVSQRLEEKRLCLTVWPPSQALCPPPSGHWPRLCQSLRSTPRGSDTPQPLSVLKRG